MRFAGNFHPEWGYLAPAPNFMRTARVVVVATAIGATAGAAVVLSLAERSAPGAVADAGKTLVVVHSLVQPAEAAAPAAPAMAPVAATTPSPVIASIVPAAPVAPAKVQASVAPSVQQSVPANPQISAPPVAVSAQPFAPPPAPSDSRAVSTSAAPASVAALSESPPVTEASPPAATNDVVVSPVPLAPQKDAVKKPAAAGQQPPRGPLPAVAAAPRKKPEEHGLGLVLRRLFSAN
jgi:hypothetical protein